MTSIRTHLPRLLGVATLACVLAGPAVGQGVLLDKSEIRFTAKQLGVNLDGRFRRFKADVAFVPTALQSAKADVEVDLGSIDLASDESEKEVKGPLWFDAGKYPVARFTSTRFRDLGGGRYEIAGRFALKGITRDIVVPITVTRDAAGNQVAAATFSLKRLEYKIGEGAWADTDTVADPVTVRVRLVLAPTG